MQPRDDTTRYLCAAVHLDPGLAEQAIREYLVETTRAVPPAPGVNAPVVLGEALAAWYRGKVRDWALLAGLVVFAVLASSTLIIAWIVIGVAVTMMSGLGQGGPVVAGVRSQLRTWTIMAAVIAVGGLLLIGPVLSEIPGAPADGGRSTALDVGAALFGVVLFAILLGDELTVWRLLTQRFSRATTVLDMPSQQTRYALSYVADRYTDQLVRVRSRQAAADALHNGHGGTVPVIVARGYAMFVGAGVEMEPWSVALPLERRADVEVTPLTNGKLYESVWAAFGQLRGQVNLSPSLRFAELKIGETVVVAAEELVDRAGEPEIAAFLPDANRPPADRVPTSLAHELGDRPQEWARYYLTVELETWDRDFVVSAFLHFAVDEGILYLEWTPCVLRPIKSEYRAIDSVSRSPAHAVQKAFIATMALPATVPARLLRLSTRIRPLRREVLTPQMFGVLRSLREMAADSGLHNYFQLTDQERYVKVLESRLILALTRLLHDSGYSTATFEQRVASVVNNGVYFGANSSFSGVNFGGSHNTAQAPAANRT